MKRVDGCKNCQYFNPQIDPNNLGAGKGLCMITRPIHFPLVTPAAKPGDPISVQIFWQYPQVNEQNWCRDWEKVSALRELVDKS